MNEATVLDVKAGTGAAAQKRTGSRLPKWLYGWLLPLLLLTIWEIAARLNLVSETMLPAPSLIAAAFGRLAASGELAEHLRSSFIRAGGGFLLGGTIGLLLGVFTGLGKWAERTLDPSLQMLRTVPLLAVIPLFILWFGVGELSKWLLISIGAFFPLYFHTFLGVRSIDFKLYEVSKVLEYSKLQLMTQVILPAALPNILLGLRLSVGTSWLLLAVAEMMGASSGVGYMIQDARVYMQTDIVFVGIILFALVGKLTDSAVWILERRWLHWQNTYKG
ncbi:sulfonate transport system permease protein [Paenibacillus phyllosphaerae]|uniref:Sulfonate transport system permease protein n=1 Tax=Paenibacillus phyllosphaerae TaxID=274593 RepID=A0A7W5AZ58_9BACL|nr:ABC transporter permease [Paenibacillus phyllosphaerae]MBB3111439.1 sulfonate transport system permease protein [Paenibacillus phyllosphaerae]